jgi:putative redox protein
MAVTVKASLGKEKYYTEVVAGENILITDEPVDKGGQNKGFNPFEILATSLASCTAATLRMYIDRKEWDVEKINVEVELENFPLTKRAIFKRDISFEGTNLNDEQMRRLHTNKRHRNTN